jgi:hypothetical protein
MKMNSLTALRTVCDRVGSPAGEAMLEAHKPHAYKETVGGRTMAQVLQLWRPATVRCVTWLCCCDGWNDNILKVLVARLCELNAV